MPRRTTGGASGFDQKPESGEAEDSVFIGFSQERQRQGRVDSVGLASSNNPGGLWAARAAICLPLSLPTRLSTC